MSTYRPGEAASMLGVASATLRRYSVQFSEHLSPSASAAVAQSGGALERRYTESDIALLKRASGMLERGLTFDQVRAQLGQAEQSGAPNKIAIAPDTGLALVELVSGAQRETIAAQKETIALLHDEVERLRKKLAISQEIDQNYSDLAETSAKLSQIEQQEAQSEIERLRAELERQQQRYMGIIRKILEQKK